MDQKIACTVCGNEEWTVVIGGGYMKMWCANKSCSAHFSIALTEKQKSRFKGVKRRD